MAVVSSIPQKNRQNQQQLKREYQNRRQQIKRKQRLEFWLNFWRSLLLLSLAGGLGWVITRPNWVIRESTQIKVKGNEFLSERAIRDLLPVSYPQSILRLPNPKLLQELESKPPIAEVKVTRQILPPSLTVEVKERQPVAIVFEHKPSEKQIGQNRKALGFLDAEGVLLPKSFYTSVRSGFQLPTLKIIGFREQNHSDWSEVYQLISHSTVKISELDWRDSNNLMLKTELGKVHLGANTRQLPQQLKVLALMSELPSEINLNQVDYIDLTNPKAPTMQMLQPPSAQEITGEIAARID